MSEWVCGFKVLERVPYLVNGCQTTYLTKLREKEAPSINSWKVPKLSWFGAINYNQIIELSVKATLCFTPYLLCFRPPIPSFSGIHKVTKFYLIQGMKCWNSAFNAQGSRVIIVVVQVGAVSENICSSSGGGQVKRKDRMKLSLPPKLVEKLSLGPSYLLL